VIDSLAEQATEEDIAVVILYCDYQEQHKQTTTNMIGSILKQLVFKDQIPESVLKALMRAKNECGGRGLRLQNLVAILRESIAPLPQVFVCIDALDEFVSEKLPELLLSLRDIVQELPNVHVFLTGRPFARTQISRHFTTVVTIPISPKQDEIVNYLQKKFEMDTEAYEMNDVLRTDIIEIIQASISKSFVRISKLMIIYLLTIMRRFLLVSLSIDAILKEVTVSARREKLNQMSKGIGLGDVYAETLERMKAQKGPRLAFGMNALMWVAHSERPLRASELRQALEVEIGSTDLNPGSGPAVETLLGWSLGLLILEKSSATVRLVHFTLRDHLSNNPALFGSPHSTIAEICLTYLNSQSVQKLPPSLSHPTKPETSLLNYASCYWERHARRGMTQDMKPLVLGLLDGFGQHASSRVLWRYGGYPIELPRWSSGSGWDKFRGFTCIHWTASLGMLEMTSALLEMKEWDLNVADATGNTAIAWAARGGHTDILKRLLKQKDADPNIADKDGRTSLSWAAWRGDKGVVNILLERKNINLDPVDSDGRTPLLWAVSMGNGEAVKLILERKDAAFGLTPNCKIPVAFSTEPPALPQPPSKRIRSFWLLLPKPNTRSPYTTLAIQILTDCLVISASLCLLVFLSWVIPQSTISLPFHYRRALRDWV